MGEGLRASIIRVSASSRMHRRSDPNRYLRIRIDTQAQVQAFNVLPDQSNALLQFETVVRRGTWPASCTRCAAFSCWKRSGGRVFGRRSAESKAGFS